MTNASESDFFFAEHEELLFLREKKRARDAEVEDLTVGSPPYLFRLAQVPIKLSAEEYRIIRFLSRRPYKAYTPQQIVDAVSISEEALDQNIRSLRDKLGIFSDFVQSVPYIGYRFKP